LGTAFTTTFTVNAAGVGAGTSPLTVVKTNPLDGTAWTSALGYGSVTFSAPLNPDSSSLLSRFSAMLVPHTGGVTTGTSGYADVPVDAKLAFNPNTDQLVIVPTGVLRNDTVYLFSLSNIKAKSGAALGGTVFSTFLFNDAQAHVVVRSSQSAPIVVLGAVGVPDVAVRPARACEFRRGWRQALVALALKKTQKTVLPSVVVQAIVLHNSGFRPCRKDAKRQESPA
jgi:hypothetical protein